MLATRGLFAHIWIALVVLQETIIAVSGYRSSSTLLVGGAGSSGNLYSCAINSGSSSPCSATKTDINANGVAVDALNKRLYYTYAGGVASRDMDGNNFKHVLSTTSVANQWTAIVIDEEARQLYLSDPTNEVISKTSLDAPGIPTDVQETIVARSLTLDTSANPTMIYWSEQYYVARKAVDGSGSQERLDKYTDAFANYQGIILYKDFSSTTHLYVVNSQGPELTRINIATLVKETLLAASTFSGLGLAAPTALALDPRTELLYISDSTSQKIVTSTFAGSVATYHSNIQVANTAAVVYDPVPAVTLSTSTVQLVEGSRAVRYNLTLDRSPSANVVIATAASAASQLSVSPSTITFGATTWDVPQTVTVNAVQDSVDNGQRMLVVNHSVTSTDPTYSSLQWPAAPSLMVRVAENFREKLLFSNEGRLYRANRKDGTGREHVPGLQSANVRAVSTAVTYAPPLGNLTERVVWADSSNDVIGTALVDGTGAQKVVSGNDWLTFPASLQAFRLTAASYGGGGSQAGKGAALHVLWADRSRGELGAVAVTEAGAAVANASTLLSGLGQPLSVAVDYCRNVVYWADATGAVSRQSIAAASGGGLEATATKEVVVAASAGNGAPSIALDLRRRVLYWSNSGTKQISRAPMDSSSTLSAVQDPWLSPTDSANPIQLSVDTIGGALYWLDGWLSGSNDYQNTVRRTPITTSGVLASASTTTTIASALTNPQALALAPSMPSVALTFPGIAAGAVPSVTEGEMIAMAVKLDAAVAAGDTVVIELRLSQPEGDLSSGSFSPALLTFTSGNWNSAQTVQLTAGEDLVDQGGRDYHIIAAVVHEEASAAGAPGRCTAPPSEVTGQAYVHVIEDDHVGVVVTDCHGKSASEGGAPNVCKVKLNSEPLGDVTVSVIGDDGGKQMTFAPASLVFTSSSWDTEQPVTATAIDDTFHDAAADNSVVATFASGSAGDNSYAALKTKATLSVIDNDAIAIVLGSSALTTKETAAVTYTVALASTPTQHVLVDVSTPTQCFVTSSVACWPIGGTASPPMLNFSTSNWNQPQTVTVTPVDDRVDAGTRTFSLGHTARSGDARYEGTLQSGPAVTVTEDDSVGFQWSISPGDTVGEGASQAVTLKLTSIPSATVTVKLTPNQEPSDKRTCTLSTYSVDFSATDWDTPKPVVLTMGEDDNVEQDWKVFISTTSQSTDGTYNGLVGSSQTLRVVENDFAGIVLEFTAPTPVTEAANLTYKVALRSQPTSDVQLSPTAGASVPLVFLDGTAEPTQLIFTPASLTFTSATWATPQTVFLDAPRDYVDNSPHGSKIVVNYQADSADARYKVESDLTILYQNIDVAKLSVSTQQLQLLEGGEMPEYDGRYPGTVAPTGGWATYQLTMHTKPRTAVTVQVTPTTVKWGGSGAAKSKVACVAPPPPPYKTPSSTETSVDTRVAAQGEVAEERAVWAAWQAGNDSVVAAAHSAFLANTNVSLTAQLAAATVSLNASAQASMAAGAAAVAAVQAKWDAWEQQLREHASCERTATPSFAGVTVSPSAITFTQADWNTPRTITVTAVDDNLIQSDRQQLIEHTVTSADAHYENFSVPHVSAHIEEDDKPGLVLNWTQVPALIGDALSNASSTNRYGLQTADRKSDRTYRCGHAILTENMPLAEYVVRLAAKPTADVTVGIWMPHNSSSDMVLEGNLSTLLFTTRNWNVEQTVRVKVIDNEVVDGDRKWEIPHTMSSTDSLFDFTRSVHYYANVSALAARRVAVAQGVAEAKLPPAPTWNWTHAAFDPVTGGVSVGLVHIADNDRASVWLAQPRLSLAEGTDKNFTIRLTAIPTAPVTIHAAPKALIYWKHGVKYTHQLSIEPLSLVFTPSNWRQVQEFRLVADDDWQQQGDRTSGEVSFTVSSADVNYQHTSSVTCDGGGAIVHSACSKDNPQQLAVTVWDDDVKGCSLDQQAMELDKVSRISSEVGFVEGSYEVFINSEPVSAVTVVVELSTTATPPAVVNAREVVFEPAKWDVRRSVAISADNDKLFKGFDIKHATISHRLLSSDPLYSNMTLSPLCVTWKDDMIDAGCPTEHTCVNGGTCMVTRACDCPTPYGGRGCARECSANGCDFERVDVTVDVDPARAQVLTAEDVRIALQRAMCDQRNAGLKATAAPTSAPGGAVATLATAKASCQSKVGDGGICPGIEVTVAEISERRCIPKNALSNSTETVPCVLCKVDLSGSATPNGYKRLHELFAAKNPTLVALGVRAVTEKVMYDKCEEFLGCFPEKVKFEEAVVCGTIAVGLLIGGLIIYHGGKRADNRIAPKPSGQDSANPAPKKQAQVRAAFRNLAM